MKRQLVERELGSDGPMTNSPRAGRRRVTVNLAESPLTWLHARGHLSDAQLAAGECLRRDYERAQLGAGVTMRWDVVHVVHRGGERGLNLTERQLAARERFDGALAMAGRDLSDILWRVVCAGESLASAERALAWPARSGKLVLRIALDRVAGYYRIR
ncbi:DUF6456 domain-containing protein [Novosphingobium sp.]|uniref:DUF6456 domain-containing protein n=1 Tax=Novosphingobium sp. TaxID=1874826 RepID=UPI0022CD1DE6|nr:DUF6456 domain-containing protein [Novosphingobium sp.]MCZ8017500.1 DUF6456 domain-containing protein [Novosphingobium sp.]MCZ8033976.1 DUF6456 domain-containing protein [Novosphingobium sp.]MCZ8051332.1 DUF6456 domain-containing protein [Novosphingobium sp.]MCZ8059678.1 DUF6456 domain-containing protein [Novosphingobium sp.]MCZ8231516.1 DUF6456 domain-containing protein [Novosphingobium sp.]